MKRSTARFIARNGVFVLAAAAIAGCSLRQPVLQQVIGDQQAAEIIQYDVVARFVAEASCGEDKIPSDAVRVDGLLLLLDRFTASEADYAIATLLQYYLGEGPNEILSCIVLRRGRDMIPQLHRARTAGNTACIETLGADSKRCLSSGDLNSRLDGFEESISAGRTCDLGQFASPPSLQPSLIAADSGRERVDPSHACLSER